MSGPHEVAPVAGMLAWLRGRLRNVAPFVTLLLLVAFFSVASGSFATLGNLQNILTQISVTGIIAVGLTFVILCAEIDLSVASIANATGIVVAYFTLQDASVTIANIPLPGWAAIIIALSACFALGRGQCVRTDAHRHSQLHHDAWRCCRLPRASARCWFGDRSPMRCRR